MILIKNIAFIGGSITEGAGVSTIRKSFFNIVGDYLKSVYTDVNIINLGAGGTASDFGTFRIKKQLKGIKPDLIFVEFSVNDRIYNTIDSSINFEALVREIIDINSKCKVVILILPTGIADSCVGIHKKIGYYYNIPVVDIQDKVWMQIGQDKYSWKDISIDNLHPNELGHNIFADIIIEELKLILSRSDVVKIERNPLMGYLLRNPSIDSYECCTFYGHWREEKFNLNNKFDLAAVSNTIEDCLEYKFTGKHLSMMNLLSSDFGILECELDNKYTFEVDLYSEIDNRFETTINLKNIGEGNHTLLVKVSNRKNIKSKGNKVVIGGFLVESM